MPSSKLTVSHGKSTGSLASGTASVKVSASTNKSPTGFSWIVGRLFKKTPSRDRNHAPTSLGTLARDQSALGHKEPLPPPPSPPLLPSGPPSCSRSTSPPGFEIIHEARPPPPPIEGREEAVAIPTGMSPPGFEIIVESRAPPSPMTSPLPSRISDRLSPPPGFEVLVEAKAPPCKPSVASSMAAAISWPPPIPIAQASAMVPPGFELVTQHSAPAVP